MLQIYWGLGVNFKGKKHHFYQKKSNHKKCI